MKERWAAQELRTASVNRATSKPDAAAQRRQRPIHIALITGNQRVKPEKQVKASSQ